MIKVRLIMNFAVVNVDRRKEKARLQRRRELKRHGMHRLRAGFQFEDGKTKCFVAGQFGKRIFRQTKALVQSSEISNGRDKGCFETSNLEHLQWAAAGRSTQRSAEHAPRSRRCR